VTARIFLKLMVAVVCVLAVSLFAVDYVGARLVEKLYLETLSRQMADKGRLVAQGRWQSPEEFGRLARASGGRVTIVGRDGHVLADSENEAARMENHANRPEIAEALAGRTGVSKHLSNTMRTEFLYVAVPVPDGALRVAVPLSRVQEEIHASRWQMIGTTSLAFLPAAILAALFARYVSSRLGSIIDYADQLAHGNFRARLADPGRDEFGVLSSRLNETGEKLEEMFTQLQHEQVELEKLERVRKDFVINVSHELRTPLASIQGYAETLLDGALDDPRHNVRFVQIIRQNAERLTRLTADLLSLSRIEMKRQSFHCEQHRLWDLLTDARDSLQPLADRQQVTLVLAGDEQAAGYCDAEAVHQMLSNLLDNALKYTPAGGQVTLQAGLRGDGMAEIGVRDTGVGIPAEDLPRLFERFYRVDKARSRELGGTGLGLAIVKHLARSMGGDVMVSSVVGQGSEFSFTVPGQAGQEPGGEAQIQPEFTAT